MNSTVTYKTSFLKDSYSIFEDDGKIGKLYKSEWTGPAIDTTINKRNFRFVTKGIFRTSIAVIDKVVHYLHLVLQTKTKNNATSGKTCYDGKNYP